MKINRTVELDGEKVHLAKDSLGWRVVHPIRDENGKINWINFLLGGKANLLTLILIIIIASILFYGVATMFESCSHLAAHPEDFCRCAKCPGNILILNQSLFNMTS